MLSSERAVNDFDFAEDVLSLREAVEKSVERDAAVQRGRRRGRQAQMTATLISTMVQSIAGENSSVEISNVPGLFFPPSTYSTHQHSAGDLAHGMLGGGSRGERCQ
jgi:hypothetical protein